MSLSMHVERLTLERVFDVQRLAQGDEEGPHTLFSFEANGVRHFALKVPGHPVIEPGHRLSFVLATPGNWQTLAGWHNHTTGDQVLPDSDLSLVGAAMFGLGAVVAAIAMRSAETTAQMVGTSLVMVVSALFALGSLRAGLRQGLLGEQIRSLAAEAPADRPPA